MTNLQITARGPRAEAEAAAAAIDADPRLEASAYAILEEDEAKGVWRLDIYPTADDEADAFLALLRGRPALQVASAPLADADWLALALSGLPPVRAGRFFVFGAHDRGRIPANAVGLRIEAGAAFGTGHHGTTTGCLVAYDGLLKARSFASVLDVGTGTGVLAIAAARALRRRVLASDIDAAAVRVARDNARLNRVGPLLEIANASGVTAPTIRARAPFDLVFANILLEPLQRLASPLARIIAPGGRVVLSGLLTSQANAALAAYRGLALERRIALDGWTTLVLQRRIGPRRAVAGRCRAS